MEIRDKYAHVATTDQKYDTKTSGVCIDVMAFAPISHPNFPSELRIALDDIFEALKGKLVFWQEYKEGAIIERNGKKYAFIKIEDLDGYEEL